MAAKADAVQGKGSAEMVAGAEVAQRRRTPLFQSKRFQDSLRNIFVYSLLVFLSLVFIFPFFWMLDSALKTDAQIFLWPPQWIPDPVHWQNFADAFANPQLPFGVFIKNTLILEVFMITGRLLSCVVVAYGFARLEAPGKNFWFGVLLATFLLPGAVILIPKYILFNELGWVNTFLPMIVPAWFGESFAIFLLRQFFMTIPRELEEAAVIDGANTIDIIWRIMVPLSTPVLAVITIFSFRDIWNDFFTPLLYLNTADKYTAAIGLAYFNGQYVVQMGPLMAGSFVLMLPLVVVFFLAQRTFVQGINLTGLTGR